MEKYTGKKIFNGIAIGKIKFYEKVENQIVRKKVENADAELERYEQAKTKAMEQLHQLTIVWAVQFICTSINSNVFFLQAGKKMIQILIKEFSASLP